MSLEFNNTIRDDRYNFIDKDLRQVFKKAVEKAGRKKIIFVEGYDDEVIYSILYEDKLDKLYFIDTSFTTETFNSDIKATGNCEQVKQHLRDFVKHLPKEKRFYGVIDRDLKTDQEVKEEKQQTCYDGRLFIFFEAYTLENYFIDSEILSEFLTGQSINHKRLIPLIKNGKEYLENEIIKPILSCLIDIAAANLTIRYFDPSQKFIEETISCEEQKIENRIVNKLNKIEKEYILSKFSEFKKDLIEKNEALKFASAKLYFASQFNRKLKKQTKVNIQLNNHKSELARILKGKELPKDFQDLLGLVLDSDYKDV
jgi:predicted nucleic acid-binding protein